MSSSNTGQQPKQTLSALLSKRSTATSTSLPTPSTSGGGSTIPTLPTTAAVTTTTTVSRLPPPPSPEPAPRVGASGFDYRSAIANLTQQAKSAGTDSGGVAGGGKTVSTAELLQVHQETSAMMTEMSEMAKRTIVLYRKSNSSVPKSFFQNWLVRTYSVSIQSIVEMSPVDRLLDRGTGAPVTVVYALLDTVETHDKVIKMFQTSNTKLQEQCTIRPAVDVAVEGYQLASTSSTTEPSMKRAKASNNAGSPPVCPKSLDDCWVLLLAKWVENVQKMDTSGVVAVDTGRSGQLPAILQSSKTSHQRPIPFRAQKFTSSTANPASTSQTAFTKTLMNISSGIYAPTGLPVVTTSASAFAASMASQMAMAEQYAQSYNSCLAQLLLSCDLTTMMQQQQTGGGSGSGGGSGAFQPQ